MGQILQHLYYIYNQIPKTNQEYDKKLMLRFGDFPDLNKLPPELALSVLSKLDATDLCLAGCVWSDLANDEYLWESLCRHQWVHVSAYKRMENYNYSYKKLYLLLDEGTLTFNADPEMGIKYLIKTELIDDTVDAIALFLHTCRNIDWDMKRKFLSHPSRQVILEQIIKQQNFKDLFLPNALRKFFYEAKPPNERGTQLEILLDRFSTRFCECNPNLGLTKDTVYIVCFSLIMLSVDLKSPHVKNKMSKREFIRNTRQAATEISDDFAGHLYDNIYLIGHIAPKA